MMLSLYHIFATEWRDIVTIYPATYSPAIKGSSWELGNQAYLEAREKLPQEQD